MIDDELGYVLAISTRTAIHHKQKTSKSIHKKISEKTGFIIMDGTG